MSEFVFLRLRNREEEDVRAITSSEEILFKNWTWVNPEYQRVLSAQKARSLLGNPAALKHGSYQVLCWCSMWSFPNSIR
jgi:hypothetical protein